VRSNGSPIAIMAEAIGVLERDPEDAAAVVALLESARAVRRDARGPMRGQLVELASKIEAVLQRVRQGLVPVDTRMLEALSASVSLAAELTAISGAVEAEATGMASAPPLAPRASVELHTGDALAPPGLLTVAVVGAGARAAEIVGLLAEDERVAVVAVCAPSPGTPAFAAARELGIATTLDLASLADPADISLVIDVSEDPEARARLEATLPPDVQLVGPAAAYLLGELLGDARVVEAERERSESVRAEMDRVRRHASHLAAGHQELERANESLNRELAETYFIHEFFKSLTRARDVDDVCSVIVDDTIGLLGAEIAAIYVLAEDGHRAVLRASQGRTEPAFVSAALTDAGVFAAALEAPLFETDRGSGIADWVREPLYWQVAMPLAAGREVLGVLLGGGTVPRVLEPADRERFGVVAEQCALALQNAMLHEDLELLAVTDRMTGMYNHVYGVQRLEEEVNRAARFGHSLSLVMLDIDDFKSFNDAYGHPVGDELLALVGAVIRRALRDMDIAVRYGGEEFAVILPETPASGGWQVAERIRKDIDELRIDSRTNGPVHRTVSLGIAEYPSDATSGRSLVEAADRALYRAKRAGKNRVESA
jgi:diguanylate cyclase (GGDEF)-like protein